MSVDHHLKRPEEFNRSNPFSVPNGYFDHLHEKILSRIGKEEKTVKVRRIKGTMIQKLRYLAAAACILLIGFSGVLFWKHTPRALVSENTYDKHVEQWMYMLDKTTMLAALVDMEMPEETCCSEEQEGEIIAFLERENITIADIVHSIDDDDF